MDKKEQNRKRNAEFHERLRKNPEKAAKFNKEKYQKTGYKKKTLDRNGTFLTNNCLNTQARFKESSSNFNYKTYLYLKEKYPWMNLAIPVAQEGPIPVAKNMTEFVSSLLRFPPSL